MRIYFAAPLFNDAERRFNADLTGEIEARGHRVFLPQRDGFEIAGSAAGEAPTSSADLRRAIFTRDQSEVFAADLLLAVLDGRVPDEGVALEIGLAWAHRDSAADFGHRRIVGLKTDVRASFLHEALNPMLREALDELFIDTASLLAWLDAQTT